jgi:hypothetical protein
MDLNTKFVTIERDVQTSIPTKKGATIIILPRSQCQFVDPAETKRTTAREFALPSFKQLLSGRHATINNISPQKRFFLHNDLNPVIQRYHFSYFLLVNVA